MPIIISLASIGGPQKVMALLYEEIELSEQLTIPAILVEDEFCCPLCAREVKKKHFVVRALKVTLTGHPVWDSPDAPGWTQERWIGIPQAHCPQCDLAPRTQGAPIIMPGSYYHNMILTMDRGDIWVTEDVLAQALLNRTTNTYHAIHNASRYIDEPKSWPIHKTSPQSGPLGPSNKT